MPVVGSLFWLKRHRYIIISIFVILATLGAVSILYMNLVAIEKNTIQEYESLGEQINKSLMNNILKEQYGNIYDIIRLLVSTSNVQFIAIYFDGKMHTQAGEPAFIEDEIQKIPVGPAARIVDKGMRNSDWEIAG